MVQSTDIHLTGRVNQTARFLVYDRNTGAVLAVHEISAALGGDLPGPDRIELIVLREAAFSVGRPESQLAVRRYRGAVEYAGTLKVDLRTERVIRLPGKKTNWIVAPPAVGRFSGQRGPRS